MCDKHIAGQLRDREFDSLVGHDFNKAQEVPAQAAQQQAQPDPFAAINAAWSDIVNAPSFEAAQERARAAIDTTLQGYYLGRGNFDHVRFLADLERTKGSPLNELEYRFFGRIIGDWTGSKAAAETNAALEHGDLAEAEAIFLAVLS